MVTTPSEEGGAKAPSTLRGLLAQVEKATGANLALEQEIEAVLGIGRVPPPAYTYSLDAAVALVERLLPKECHWELAYGGAKISGPGHLLPGGEATGYHDEAMFEGAAQTLPLALLKAILKTLIAQAESP